MAKRLAKLADLTPDQRNANRGTERGRAMLEHSLRQYGAGRSVLADKHGNLIAGNKTVEVAAEIGLPIRTVETDGRELVVVQRRDLDLDTDAAARELAYADNRVAQVSLDWELAQIGADIDAGVDLSALWSEDELAALLGEDGGTERLTDPDAVPVVPDAPTTRPGDLWRLGEHRLLCGDSTVVTDVERLMAGAEPCACVTDPPYGQSQAGVTNDDPAQLSGIIGGFVAILPPTVRTLVAFQSPRTFPELLDAARQSGWKFERMLWLYKKAQEAYPWRGWLLKSEAILVLSRSGGSWHDLHPYSHDTYEVTEVSGELSEDIGWHGSVKPARIVTDIVGRVTPDGAALYDPFLGSGTTLIAAEQLGRRCYGLEISPKYCDVIVRRWEEFTGRQAVRDGT